MEGASKLGFERGLNDDGRCLRIIRAQDDPPGVEKHPVQPELGAKESILFGVAMFGVADERVAEVA